MKTVVRRLKISNLGHHHLSRTIFIYLIRFKTPACELYLVYSVTSFAARTGVNYALKIFKDNLKTSPNNNYRCKRRVFKISGVREEASCALMTTVTLRFDGVITGVIMSALKKIYK